MSKLIMMIGLPASGKSTIAKKYAKKENAIIISTDELRQELLGNENSQENNELIFKEAEKRLKENIINDKNVIFDATNISYKRRIDWLNRFNKFNVYKIAILIATPYEECLLRNAKRDRKVPEEVIKNMYHNFYVPQYYEGFNKIIVEYNSNYTFVFDDLQDIPQDNPHHRLSVLEHCKLAKDKAVEIAHNDKIFKKEQFIRAALLHDIGKLKTKTFINAKGEETETAHFYNHEKVSAYDSLFNYSVKLWITGRKPTKILGLRTIALIQWHMLLWLDLSNKSVKKYKNLLGENFWKELEKLHIADKEAH